MTSPVQDLTEPHVLAHTKRRLFPDEEADGTYAVVDTQFTSSRWLGSEYIDPAVKEVLTPFNHVRIGSGYPDLVGVCRLDRDLLAARQSGDQLPLVVVEAKGYTDQGTVDVEQGVVQAHDRLSEANVAFIAAPVSALSQSVRVLSRELNVGVLGVEADGTVEPLEVPRIVGNQSTTETTAIRFQASAQGVVNKSFGLNHPKNYLAYPLAVSHPGDTEQLIGTRVVRAVTDARKGAAFLDLIDRRPAGVELTPLGREVVRFALREYGAVDTALDAFDDWKRSQKRFCDLVPRWGALTRRVIFAYPATQVLVEEIQQMHNERISEPTLCQLVKHLHERRPSFTVELFLRGDEAGRQQALTADGQLRTDALDSSDIFHAPTVFQLKAMMYHAGILTQRGTEPSNLDPTTDVWALRERL